MASTAPPSVSAVVVAPAILLVGRFGYRPSRPGGAPPSSVSTLGSVDHLGWVSK